MAIKEKEPEKSKVLVDLKSDKQLLREQHPVASRFVLAIWRLYSLITMVGLTVFEFGSAFVFVVGLGYLSNNKFALQYTPRSINGISIVAIYSVIGLIDIILKLLERPATNLYHKYYED